MRLRAWKIELEKLAISDSEPYREMVKELSWNMDNNKTSGVAATPSQVISSLVLEKEERERNNKSSVGGRRDIGIFMYVMCHRIKELKSFTLFFNNSAGNTVHNARKEMVRLEEMTKDMPGGLGLFLALDTSHDRNGMKILNASLGHID